jgi:hypothetical protein
VRGEKEKRFVRKREIKGIKNIFKRHIIISSRLRIPGKLLPS